MTKLSWYNSAVSLWIFTAFCGVSSADLDSARGEATPSVADILSRVDQQMTFDSRAARAVMKVAESEGTREFELKLFSRGDQDTFIAFIKPERDRGNRILKLQGQLWTYFPRTEKTVKISGHMLRQPMMGSDLSYEDITENRGQLQRYNGTVVGDAQVGQELCYVVHLKEKAKGLSYPEIKQWISKKNYLPVREERYASTGKLLKVFTFGGVQKFGNRNYPTQIIVEDKLKQGSRTEFTLHDLQFGADVQRGMFDLRNLEREGMY